MRENAFKVLWGLDNTAGLNVICVTLAINDVPNFHYFRKRLFIYFHVSDSWGMGLRGTCLCRKVLSDIHFHAPKRAEVPPKRSLAWEKKRYAMRLRKLCGYNINRACAVISTRCIQAWLPPPH